MGWSTFWIGDFELPDGERPLEERAPSLASGELEWVRYDGRSLHVRRTADRDDDAGADDYVPLLARVKSAGGKGKLACIAWEDGPNTFGLEYGLKSKKPRAMTVAEIAALFEENAEPMRAMLAREDSQP